MSRVTCDLTISLDGFLAGPNQTLADPLGEGGELSTLRPVVGRGELLLAEQHTDLAERPLRMWHRQVHRHVEVVHAGGEGTLEDPRVEPRRAGVEHDVGVAGAGQFGDRP